MMLDHYLYLFGHLRTDRGQQWPPETLHRAPHKPILLLSVLDLFERGEITNNLIEPEDELVELFAKYWSRVGPPDRKGEIAYPFFHLKTSGFWTLLPQLGQEAILASGAQIRYLGQLRRAVLGAQLPQDLFELLCAADSRELLRRVLVSSYFASELHSALDEQAIQNLLEHEYSASLLDGAMKHSSLLTDADIPPPVSEPVRNQGFRRAVVTAYDHRYALCGVRVVTSSGHTIVDAAHIIPWRVGHNDDPRNGLALCRLCHAMFDEGLATVSDDYYVLLSPQLKSADNNPGLLLALEHRDIIRPSKQRLWPAIAALQWHRKNIYQTS